MKKTRLLIWAVALCCVFGTPAKAGELAPGLNACLRHADELGNPESPKFAGMGEARVVRRECYDNALVTLDKELNSLLRQAINECPQKPSPEDCGVEPSDCRNRFETSVALFRKYRDANMKMREMYFAGCPTCVFCESVENAIRETKQAIKSVKYSMGSYLNESR